MLRPTFALIAAALLGAPLVVPAQNAALTPRFGELTLAVGFLPDPAVHPAMAGGGEAMINVAELRLIDAQQGHACGTFYIDAAPSVRLALDAPHLDAEAAPSFQFLRLYADVPAGSSTDPALLVQQPDGSWRCADDSHLGAYHGLMPIIDFEEPAPGDYSIWVGSYLRNPGAPATLFLTAHSANLPSQSGY